MKFVVHTGNEKLAMHTSMKNLEVRNLLSLHTVVTV